MQRTTNERWTRTVSQFAAALFACLPVACGNSLMAQGLVDTTPPVIDLSVVGDREVNSRAPYMPDYFIAPVNVFPVVSVTDDLDAIPTIEVTHNGSPYVQGTPITDLGYHKITAVASDPSGNEARKSIRFEIRSGPWYFGHLIVESFDFTPNNDGTATVAATVLFTSDQFNLSSVSLPTVCFWLADDRDVWMNKTIKLAGAFGPEGGAFHVDTAQAELIADGRAWRMRFSETFRNRQPNSIPSQIELALCGRQADGSPFTVWSETFPAASVDPLGLLQEVLDELTFPQGEDPPGEDLPDPGDIVPEDPPLGPLPEGCFEEAWYNQNEQEMGVQEGSTHCYCTIGGKATPTSISGWGDALDNHDQCTGSQACSRSASSGGTYKFWKAGDDSCCHNCELEVVMRPTFIASATVDNPAMAAAFGRIKIDSGCDGCEATAEGGVAVGTLGGDFVNFFGVPIPIEHSSVSKSEPFGDNEVCNCECNVTISILTQIGISVNADGDATDKVATAKSRISEGKAHFELHVSCDGVPRAPRIYD